MPNSVLIALKDKNNSSYLLLACLCLFTFFIYAPGLSGSFIFDDFVNIVANDEVHLQTLSWAQIKQTLLSGPSSELRRPLAMLSFGMDYYLHGLDPYYFKLTNILLHMVTGIGVFLLSRQLVRLCPAGIGSTETRSSYTALLIAACWMLHPLNISTTLYIVQRMAQMSALLMIYCLYFYCRFRQKDKAGKAQGLFSFALLSILSLAAVLSKENAALIPAFILLFEVFFFKFHGSSPGQKIFLKSFLFFFIACPLLLLLAYSVYDPDWLLSPYDRLPFSLSERLLTETRVLWNYIYWILVPDVDHFSFYYDNFPVSSSPWSPPSTFFSIAGLLVVALAIIYLRNKAPALCFGLAFFFIGHGIESTVIGLELVFEHRNYLPALGLIFGFIMTILNLPAGRSGLKAASAYLGLYLIFLTYNSFLETQVWSTSQEHLLTIEQRNPDSHRITHNLGYMYLSLASLSGEAGHYAKAREYYLKSYALHPQATRSLVGLILTDARGGQDIEDSIVRELEHRIRDYPLRNYILIDVADLVDCWYSGLCLFDKTILVRMYNAIAQNTHSSRHFAQGMLNEIASATAQHYGRPLDALGILYLAESLSDSLTLIDLKIIHLEIESGNLEQARAHFIKASQKSGTPRLLRSLKQLNALLREQEGKA